MVLDPIPQSLPVDFFGSRPQPPTSHVYHGRSRECSRLSFRHSQCSIANVYQGHGTVNQGTSRECPPKTIIGLFCRISSLLSGSFAKETYNFARMSTKDIRMYTTAALENVYRGHSEVYHGSSRECPRLPCRHSQCSIANVYQGHRNVHQGTSRECQDKTVSMHGGCLHGSIAHVYQGHSDVHHGTSRECLL